MLKIHQRTNKDFNCLICLENNPTSFISHDEDKKILHVVACSMDCLKPLLIGAREQRTDISCPLCRKKITHLNDDKIFSLEEIEETRKQIACHLLKEDEILLREKDSKAKKLITSLQSQFNPDYFSLEKTVPILFNSIRSGLRTSEEGIAFLKQHMNASKKNFSDWAALYVYNQTNPVLNAKISNEICEIARTVLSKQFKVLEKKNPKGALPPTVCLIEITTNSFRTYKAICDESNIPYSRALYLCYFTEILPSQEKKIFSDQDYMSAVINEYSESKNFQPLKIMIQKHINVIRKVRFEDINKNIKFLLTVLDEAIKQNDTDSVQFLLNTNTFSSGELSTAKIAANDKKEIQTLIQKAIEDTKRRDQTVLCEILQVIAGTTVVAFIFNQYRNS